MPKYVPHLILGPNKSAQVSIWIAALVDASRIIKVPVFDDETGESPKADETSPTIDRLPLQRRSPDRV
jgi:hypothetical protein